MACWNGSALAQSSSSNSDKPAANQASSNQAATNPTASGKNAGGQVTEKAKDKATTATGQQIQQWIEKLGAEQFQVRESASAALLEIGEPALLQLSTAERGKDAETSSRAKAIRERIERDRFEAISINFKRDPDPTASYGLPGWKSFAEVAGTSRPAKRLFLEMLECHSTVALCLESLKGGSVPEGAFDGLPDEPRTRLRSVVGKTCNDLRQGLFLEGKNAEPGDLITMLVVSHELGDVPLEVHETTRMLCNMGALNRLMLMPGAQPSGRKIMGVWFQSVPVAYGSEVFNWARQYRIPEVRQTALRVLESPIEIEIKVDALMSLSAFGLPVDLPIIDKLIDNQEMTDEFNPSSMIGEFRIDKQGPPLNGAPGNPVPVPKDNNSSYRQTLGDVALMAGYRICGLDLESNFPAIRINDGGPLKNTIGFPKDNPNLRRKAIETYRKFREKAGPPPAS